MKVVYEFRCSAGSEPIEEFFTMGTAPDEVICPDHGSIARRRIGPVDFVAFPGSYRRVMRVGESVMGEPE